MVWHELALGEFLWLPSTALLCSQVRTSKKCCGFENLCRPEKPMEFGLLHFGTFACRLCGVEWELSSLFIRHSVLIVRV